MAKTDFKSIDEYQATIPPSVVEKLNSIRDIIHHEVPEVEETISYQIPCFKYHGYLIYYCAFPNHISLSSPFTNAFLTEFEKELKTYKVSKSVIQFPLKDPLPLPLIKRMIQFRKKENEAKAKHK